MISSTRSEVFILRVILDRQASINTTGYERSEHTETITEFYDFVRSECRAIATPHFDLQVKEACLGYAE